MMNAVMILRVASNYDERRCLPRSEDSRSQYKTEFVRRTPYLMICTVDVVGRY